MFKSLLALTFVFNAFNVYASDCYSYYLENSRKYADAPADIHMLFDDKITSENIKTLKSVYFCAGIVVINTDPTKCTQDVTDEDAIAHIAVTKSNELQSAFSNLDYYDGGKNIGEEVNVIFRDLPPELKKDNSVSPIEIDIQAKKCLKYTQIGNVEDGTFIYECSKYESNATLKSTINILPCSSLEDSDGFTKKDISEMFVNYWSYGYTPASGN